MSSFYSARILAGVAVVLDDLDRNAPAARVVSGVIEIPTLNDPDDDAVFLISYADGQHFATPFEDEEEE